MSLPAQQPALRVGRDPTGATWRVIRDVHDWMAATMDGVTLDGLAFDPVRGVLELLPAADNGDLSPFERERREREARRVPLEIVCDRAGNQYRSDPAADAVLVRRPCDAHFRRLPGFGGRGIALGQTLTPYGLAVDGHGFLHVADSGNHRVQVVRPENGDVVIALGAVDSWGRPRAGQPGRDGAMIEPVDVAVDPRSCRIFVLDRGASSVHVFDGRFRFERSFTPVRSSATDHGGPPLNLVALAIDHDGTLLIVDRAWHRLLHMDPLGRALAEVPLSATDHPRLAGLRLRQRFRVRGTAVVGPIDSGMDDVAWHRVIVEADIPAGAAIEVQTYASRDPGDPSPVWAPREPVAMPIPGAEGSSGEYSRLVQPADPGAALDRPSDRGRYLWVRLELLGRRERPIDEHSVAGPSVRALRVLFPRNSYLRELPRTYSRRRGEPPGAIFLERFLSLFEERLTAYEQRYEDVSRLLNPEAAPPDWLEWLASWFDVLFDPSWTTAKRRALLLEIASLYRRRGTRWGLSRFLEIYTGLQPLLIEAFTQRPPRPASPLGDGLVLGNAALGPDAPPERDGDLHAHRFTAYIYLADERDREVAAPVVERIVEAEKPAHTVYHVSYVVPDGRVGMRSTVGIDLVLGGRPRHGVILGHEDTAGAGDFRPILGRAVLSGDSRSTPTIDQSLYLE